MKKGEVHIRIGDEDIPIWNRFKSVVLEKYGKLHGVLGDEVVKAMELYLEKCSQGEHTHTRRKEEEKKEEHQPEDRKNPGIYANGGNPKTKKEMIREELILKTSNLAEHAHNGEKIRVKAFKRIIRAVTGVVDSRSVNNYLEMVLDEHLLEVDGKGYVRPMYM